MKKLFLTLAFLLALSTSAFAYTITIYTNNETLHYEKVVSYYYDCRYFRIQLGWDENNRVVLIDRWDINRIEIEQD